MPSTRLHNKWCLRLIEEAGYLNHNLCYEVNNLIDKGRLHDVGRRKPKYVTLDFLKQQFLEQYEEEVMLNVRTNVNFALAFYLHHILDTWFSQIICKIHNEQILYKESIKEKILSLLRTDVYKKLLQGSPKLENTIFNFLDKHYIEIVKDMVREKCRKHSTVLEKLKLRSFFDKIIVEELSKGKPSLLKLSAKIWFIEKALNMLGIREKVNPKVLERIKLPLISEKEIEKRSSIKIGKTRGYRRQTKLKYYKYALRILERGLAINMHDALSKALEATVRYDMWRSEIDRLYEALAQCITVPFLKTFLNAFLQSMGPYLELKSSEVAYVATLKLLGIFFGTKYLTVKCVRNIIHALGYPYDNEIYEGIKEAEKVINMLKEELRAM